MPEAQSGDFNDKWHRIQTRLKAELGDEVYSSWFGRVEVEGLERGTIHLSVPTRFLQRWLRTHYQPQLLNCCRSELPEVESLVFHVRGPHRVTREKGNLNGTSPRAEARSTDHHRPEPRKAVSAVRLVANGRDSRETFDGSPLDPRYTFENFVVAPSNRMAHAAAVQVAESLMVGTPSYNPLFIHANVGLGKTHLLQAIAWKVQQQHPNARLLYLTAERFMHIFTGALQSREALAFKETLRNIDLLLIDDIEFLQGRANHTELGHTINTLIDARRQVVVASDRAPGKLAILDARMRSRLAGGLVTEMGALDYPHRLEILRRRAQAEAALTPGFSVPEPVLEYLAGKLTESGRELEGAITRLKAFHQLETRPITLETAEQVVQDLLSGEGTRHVRIDDILRTVAKHYAVSRADIVSKRRTRSIVRPRQIGMYLAKKMTSRSLPEIGRRFGNRDHTTVIHAIRVVEKLMAEDERIREEVELLKRLIRE